MVTTSMLPPDEHGLSQWSSCHVTELMTSPLVKHSIYGNCLESLSTSQIIQRFLQQLPKAAATKTLVVARNGVILNYIYIAIIYSFTVAKWLCKMTDWLMALASHHTLPRIPNSQARRAESMRICWHLILINYSIRPILGTSPWLAAFARCFKLGLVRVRQIGFFSFRDRQTRSLPPSDINVGNFGFFLFTFQANEYFFRLMYILASRKGQVRIVRFAYGQKYLK